MAGPTRVLSLLILAVVVLNTTACSTKREPRLVVESLNTIRDDRARFLEGVLRKQLRETGSMRALLKVRAEKSAFVQEISAALIHSQPGQSRLAFFATQFNRLIGLLVVKDESFEFLLPDERLILEGQATPQAMQEALGVPIRADELSAWLVGALPVPTEGRKIYWNEETKSLISEQKLPGERRLRAGFVYRPKTERVVLLAIEVLDAEGVIVYGSFHRETPDSELQRLAIELPRQAVDLKIEIAKMSTSPERVSAEEAAQLFQIVTPAGVRRVPLSDIHQEENPSLLTPQSKHPEAKP